MEAIGAIGAVNGSKELTPEEQAQVRKLVARDREVRAHEAAHLAAAGAYAGGVEYTYQLGPDGKLYAIGGKVKITVPAGLTPEQALTAARQLIAAASAPSEPSGQDMAVASKAAVMEARAMRQIEAQQQQETAPGSQGKTPTRGLDLLA